ncbi:hypothetical protein BDQ17DRAFT_1390854 [Cyathus striatus]|nr:hypothetical protein BDQ17DRAFT_1390854 [Cyathus striatus]
MSTTDDARQNQNSVYYGNFQAAVAQTVTRSLALYFSRPVRLFRPQKISGWHSLQSLALQHGKSLSPHYIVSLIKSQGFWVIPKHFVPPMIVNAALGTILWTGYAQSYAILEQQLEQRPVVAAAISGGIAGGLQAGFAAPAENVRILMEGASGGHSWSYAWKEVFRSSRTLEINPSNHNKVEEIRQLRIWLREVGEMAGHGWRGFGWGFAKDVCAFSAFFSIFEMTRRIGALAKVQTEAMFSNLEEHDSTFANFQYPRMINSLILVIGGVVAGLAHEYVSRPWDTVRRALRTGMLSDPVARPTTILFHLISEKGVTGLFRVHYTPKTRSDIKGTAVRNIFRTLGRVGPWGFGFLVWEAYGSGLEISG